MAKDWNTDSTELWPWRCVCGRLNKKTALECPLCWKPWTCGTRHRTEPKAAETYTWPNQDWEDWDGWEETQSWHSSRSPSRHRQYRDDSIVEQSPKRRAQPQTAAKGQGKKGKKGKGKGKGKLTPESPSPFTVEDHRFAPWPDIDSTGFAPTTALPPSPFPSMASSSAGDRELVEHLKKAYPDPATMPADTKALLEKAEKDAERLGINNLYQATTHLKKSKKHLTEVLDHKRSHRSMWMAHLASGLEMWKKQLAQYKRHQAALVEQATRARTEIATCSRMIQSLGHRAADGAVPMPTAPTTPIPEAEEAEDKPDKEEEDLRLKFQHVLRNCAASLGLESTVAIQEIPDEMEDEVNEEKPQKRPRALEPFPGQSGHAGQALMPIGSHGAELMQQAIVEAVLSRCLGSFSYVSDPHKKKQLYLQAPLSNRAVSSRRELSYEGDAIDMMQKHKQTPYDSEQDALFSAFENGHADAGFQQATDDWASSSHAGSSHHSQDSPDLSTQGSGVHPPSSNEDRQDVVMFHLRDPPLRAFLDWSNYHSMIREIAYHFATNPANIIDAYEINTPIRGLPPDCVPIIVHLFPDVAVGQVAKLVLFDLEVHGHQIEAHWRLGPTTHRFVLVIPDWADRNDILLSANVDHYCRRENGRCLVWHNGFTWHDFDSARRLMAHGDHIRIAVPPSERFACSTAQLVDLTQLGFDDTAILDHVTEAEAAEGYSPSLLDEEEIRQLAVRTTEVEEDVFPAMQISLQPADDFATDMTSASSSRSHQNVPPSWYNTLHSIFQACDHDTLLVYTWYLDHERDELCTHSRTVSLEFDPPGWEDDIVYPWRHVLIPDEKYFIDLVQPTPPKSDTEEHIAHFLITQRSSTLRSALISVEFPHPQQSPVFIRFALALPGQVEFAYLRRKFQLLQRFESERLFWISPTPGTIQLSQTVNAGLCLRIEVRHYLELGSEDDFNEDSDLHELLQITNIATFDPQNLPGTPKPPTCSFTEEFLEAVDAAAEAARMEPAVTLDPFSIEAQPEVIRDLWERFTDYAVVWETDAPTTVRVETWFLHHAQFMRCHNSRIALLNADFVNWKAQLKAVWQDKIVDAFDIDVAIIHPDSEDAATGIIAQLLVIQEPTPITRAILVSVYDSDEEAARNPLTFAQVVPAQLGLGTLLDTLHMQRDCPPSTLHNHCSLWYGRIPIRPSQQIQVRDGNAFRLVVSRGILIDIPELLAMEPQQLRRTLRQTMYAEIYRRPPDPSFIIPTGAADDVSIEPVDARPSWVLAMQRLFDLHHSIDVLSGSATMNVCTWYVNDQGCHHCSHPIYLQIGPDSYMWRTEFVFPWRDTLLRATPIDFSVLVVPTDDQDPVQDINVILVQGLPVTLHAVFVSVSFPGAIGTTQRRFVHAFSHRMQVSDLVRFSVPEEVAHYPVTVRLRDRYFLSDDLLILDTGDYVAIVVHDLRGEGHPPALDLPQDALTLLQTSAVVTHKSKHHALDIDHARDECSSFTFNVGARPFLPGQLPLTTQTEFVQTLHTHWIQAAFAWEEEEPTASVLVWFVDHQLHPFPKCFQPREVRLDENFAGWEDRITQAWNDALVPHAPLEFFVVDPMPPLLEPGIAAHIILVQSARDEWSTVLVSVLDSALGPRPLRIAVTTPEHLMWEHVVNGVYYTEHCFYQLRPTQCQVWYAQQQLFPGRPIPTWSGYGFQLIITPTLTVEDVAAPSWNSPTDVSETAPSPPISSASTNLKLSYSSAQMQFEWFDAHFTLPTFDVEHALEGPAHWLPQSLDWLRIEWYAWREPVDEIVIYYDGSFRPDANVGGAAAAAFVSSKGTWWKFAGAVSAMLPQPQCGSYTAELTAALIATKQAYDLVKTITAMFCCLPAISFVFDSLSVGRQAEGLWQANKEVTTCHTVRSILRLIETRWTLKCQHHFTPGHRGDPGNEIVDTIAHCAAHGHPLQDWATFLDRLSRKSNVSSLAWCWTLFSGHFLPTAVEETFSVPARPTTTPDVQQILPVNFTGDEPASAGDIRHILLTCNVLTLLNGKHNPALVGVGGPARLQMILQQFSEAGITIFALQETRLRTQLQLSHQDYHIIQAPASPQGHYGVMLGFAKTSAFAFDADGAPHSHGWFASDDFSVIAAAPRFLIVRVCNHFMRCIVLAVHAPHSGAHLDESTHFWDTIQTSIPAKFDTWPRVLLADANCRFGDMPNRHIGTLDPERDTPKSEPFCQFVAAQNLFLPATFEDFHRGPSGTWQHQTGHWTRNDVIGIPFAWPLTTCRSWVDLSVDVSL
eukprot:s1774_g3.t1